MATLAHIQTIAQDKTTIYQEIPQIAAAFISYVNNSDDITKMDDALTDAYVSLDSKTIGERHKRQLAETRNKLAICERDLRALKCEDDSKTAKISELEEDINVLKVENLTLKSEIKELKHENATLKCEIKKLNGEIRELNSEIRELKDENTRNKVHIDIRQLIVNVQSYIFSKVTGLSQRQLNKEQIRTFSDLKDYISELETEKAKSINALYTTSKTQLGLTPEVICSFDVIRRSINDNVHPDEKTITLLERVKANASIAFPCGKATKHDAEIVCDFVERNAELLTGLLN